MVLGKGRRRGVQGLQVRISGFGVLFASRGQGCGAVRRNPGPETRTEPQTPKSSPEDPKPIRFSFGFGTLPAAVVVVLSFL